MTMQESFRELDRQCDKLRLAIKIQCIVDLRRVGILTDDEAKRWIERCT